MDDTKVRQALYLVLAALALVGTTYFNIQWIAGDFDHSVDGFLESAFANSASSSFSVDILVAFAAGAVFMLFESRRIGLAHWWIWIVLSMVVAFAFAFPLFLWARERHLATSPA